MRSENFKVILLLTLVIASLIVPMLALTNISEATVYEGLDNIFVRGKDTAYGNNLDNVQPFKLYEQGDRPPVAMAQRIGSGAVIAWGSASTCRGGITYATQRWVRGELDVLLDEMFKWMVTGTTKVLWYGDYTSTSYEMVYNDAACCSWLIADLKDNFGYTVDNTIDGVFTEITPSLLASYDVLVLPQLQLGAASTGGAPDSLPDSVVQVIKSFVEGGKGLLIMESSDFQSYNYYKVPNKILENLRFCSLGAGKYFGFQSDAVYDDSYNHEGGNYWPTLDVDATHPIGSAYQTASGKTTVDVYSPCSLVEVGPSIVVYVLPEYEVGMPGETLTYRVRVFNSGITNLTINLTKSDNSSWNPTLDNSSLGLLQPGENRTAILSVTIPGATPLCTEDEIVVTATAVEYPDVSASGTCIAHAAKRLEVTEDSYVDNGFPDQNFGDSNYLRVGLYGNNSQYAYLKFSNLDEIPDENIIEARLYLFCWGAYGPPQEMLCTEVGDDGWTELDTTWNNKPSPGATLDTKIVSVGAEAEPKAYYWDVTSFVKNQFAGDQVASFCVRPLDNCPPSTNRTFEARDWWDARLRPFLRIIYTVPQENEGVEVSISPPSQDNENGTALTYTVTVTNNGSVADNYSLTKSDNSGWSLQLSPSTLSIAAGASDTATLIVTIPSDAENDARDSVTVTATSQTDNIISDSASCVARCIIVGVLVPENQGVQVSISPTSKSGKPGETLNFSVTVTNTGTSTDTFTLTASDTEDWGPTLAITSTTLAAGASRQNIRLSITIPSTASAGDVSTITVTATGTGYDNTATCEATATGGGGISMWVYVGAAVVVIVIIAVVIIVVR